MTLTFNDDDDYDDDRISCCCNCYSSHAENDEVVDVENDFYIVDSHANKT